MPGAAPFFTIITATRNAAATLPRLLESLASQTCRDFELIIQDGASTDDTVAVAEVRRERLPALRIASEPDTGIADAWNKALPHIRGQWALFLGADDRLATPETLETSFAWINNALPSCRFAIGGVIYCDVLGSPAATPLYGNAAQVPETIHHTMIPHSATFHHTSLFLGHTFSTEYHFLSDWDFVWRTWAATDMGMDLPFPVTLMAKGGATSAVRNIIALRKEQFRLLKAHGRTLNAHTAFLVHGKALLIHICATILGIKRTACLLNTVYSIRGKTPIWE